MPRRWTSALPVAIALAFAPPEAVAQIAAGSIELEPRVSFSHESFKQEGYGVTDSFTNFDFAPSVGFCFTDHVEASVGLLARHQSVNGDGDTAIGVQTGVTYNFNRQGGVIPFAGLGFGALFYDGFSFSETAVLAPMISGGVRVLVGGSGSVNASLGYQHESNANGHFNLNANRMQAAVGVSLFPWRTRH